jgi:hypothetical protein
LRRVIVKALLLFALAVFPLAGQAIFITNAASGAPAMTSDAGLAAGSLFRVSTYGLYESGEVTPGDSLSLHLRSAGGERDLTILSSFKLSDGLIVYLTALLPEDAALGETDIVVAAKSGKSFSRHVWIVPSAFGLFSGAQNGPSVLNQLTAPILPGGFLTVRGTGLGRMTVSDVEIEILGARVIAESAGRPTDETGVDQITFHFPEGVPDDCYIPVTVRIADRASNQITVAKAERPGPCRHPFGLAAEQLQTLDGGGFVRVSSFSVGGAVIGKPDSIGRYLRHDGVAFSLPNLDAHGVEVYSGARHLDEPFAACSVFTDAASISSGFAYFSFNEIQTSQPAVRFPDGQEWELEGSGVFFQKAAPVSDDGFPLEAVPPSIFQGGDWSLRLPGSAAFDTMLPVPPPLRWTNRADMQVIPQRKDATILWEPQGYSTRERVTVSLSGSASVAGRGVYLSCRVPASEGSITIPAALVSQFVDQLSGKEAQMEVSLGQSNRERSSYSVGGKVPGLVNVSYSEQVQVKIE